MDTCVVIIDNSNVFIEGQKFSAKLKNIKKDGIADKNVCDKSWRVDFGKLLSVVSEGKRITSAVLVGSRPPLNDSVWVSAKEKGFEVIVHDRNSQGKEKAVDTEIVARGTKIICTQKEPSILKLISGDEDFLPLINIALEMGWESEVWAFSTALNSKGNMAKVATRVNQLDQVFRYIGYTQK